ncbi:hypothetical protein [Candidatus Binatus sp.]|uniref:hypothetical protein n=1 Tax=Candidatus Binatus sp. TaxID=2811406 RepID=UPI003CC5FD5C
MAVVAKGGKIACQKKHDEGGEMSDATKDDTSISFMDDAGLRAFVNGETTHVGATVFQDYCRLAEAEMNRRLARHQLKFLADQNALLVSQEALAKSLKRATWVLSIATMALVLATLVPVLLAKK